MKCIPSSAGFRFPFSRKLSWRLKWSFQSPSPSWHPCLNISVIISCYGTESIEVFIAGHGYWERFAVVSSVVPHMPRVITSFPWKSKLTSSKTAAAALRPNILPGVLFPWHLQTPGCHFCYLWLFRDCPYLAIIPLPEISISLEAEWSSNPLFQFWICLLKRQSWPYQTICFSCIEEQSMLYYMICINGEIFSSIGKYFQASDFFESLLSLLQTWLQCNVRSFLYLFTLSGRNWLLVLFLVCSLTLIYLFISDILLFLFTS